MIAIFLNKQEPCSPVKRRKAATASKISAEDEQAIYEAFDTLADTLPRRHRAELKEHIAEKCSGIAYVESNEQSFASGKDGTVCAFFKGVQLEGASNAFGADKLLHAYMKEPWEVEAESDEPKAIRKLSQLRTKYAFVLFDGASGTIFAGRDQQGSEKMYWGSNSNGDLLFCTDRGLLEQSCADADSFPAGAMFVSEPGSTTGTITDIPVPFEDNDDEESQLCRSISRSDLGGMGSRVPSQNQIAAV